MQGIVSAKITYLITFLTRRKIILYLILYEATQTIYIDSDKTWKPDCLKAVDAHISIIILLLISKLQKITLKKKLEKFCVLEIYVHIS